jgi:hypothetical protein
MNRKMTFATTALATAIGLLAGASALATEPCGDFGECKVLVEINSSDGDIGFHFLMDGDDLRRAALFNPHHRKLFYYTTRRELGEQYLTETFAESAEPLCFDPTTDDDDENDDEDFVTLADFLDRWDAGTYKFFGIGDDWELSFGQSELTFNLPAAPIEVEYSEEMDGDDIEGEISWEPGDDLGECSDGMELLPMAPEDVPVAVWEVVMEPDVDGIVGTYKYVVRIPGNAEELEVEVPDDYLETLPDNTPMKVEVGAIGFDDNATFTETDEICVNETEENGCGFDEEEE